MPLIFQSLQIVAVLITIAFRNQPELIHHDSPGVHDWPRITCRFPLSTPPVSSHFSATASARFFHTLPVRRSDVPVHSDVPDLPRCTAHNQKPANIRSVFLQRFVHILFPVPPTPSPTVTKSPDHIPPAILFLRDRSVRSAEHLPEVQRTESDPADTGFLFRAWMVNRI